MPTKKKNEPELQPLNDRQRRFVEHYAVYGDRDQAVVAAGYNPKVLGDTGIWLLEQPHVQAALQQRRAELQKLKDFDAKKLIELWMDDAVNSSDRFMRNQARLSLGRVYGVYENDNKQTRSEPVQIVFKPASKRNEDEGGAK